MRGGTLVVGYGPCLDHLSLMKHAGLDEANELYRLQIFPDHVVVELWVDDPDEASVVYPKAVQDEVVARVASVRSVARLGLHVRVSVMATA